jgi:hypothetical protein
VLLLFSCRARPGSGTGRVFVFSASSTYASVLCRYSPILYVYVIVLPPYALVLSLSASVLFTCASVCFNIVLACVCVVSVYVSFDYVCLTLPMCSLELCMYVYISVVCVCDWLAVVFRMRVCFSNIFVSFSITKMRPRPRPALTVLTI